jgi:hypothetical protein
MVNEGKAMNSADRILLSVLVIAVIGFIFSIIKVSKEKQ